MQFLHELAELSSAVVCVRTFFVLSDSIFWLFTDVHAKHEGLGSHSRHLVVETVLVHSIRMSCKCVLAVGLSLTSIYSFAVWTENLNTTQHFQILTN